MEDKRRETLSSAVCRLRPEGPLPILDVLEAEASLDAEVTTGYLVIEG